MRCSVCRGAWSAILLASTIAVPVATPARSQTSEITGAGEAQTIKGAPIGEGQRKLTLETARVQISETFALSPVRVNGRYYIKTFLPRSYLLFNVDEEKSPVAGYFSAVTQDGVKVLVRRERRKPPVAIDVFGRTSVIFNTPQRLCKEPGCKLEDDEETFGVPAGSALLKCADPSSDSLNLVGAATRVSMGARKTEEEACRTPAAGDIVVYLKPGKFADLEKRASLTRVDEIQPRFTISSADSEKVRLGCGSTKFVENYGSQAPSEVDLAIVRTFALGEFREAQDGWRLSGAPSFGGPGVEYRYRLYRFVDNRADGEEFQLAAQITYRCEQSGAETTLVQISEVILKDVKTRTPYTLKPWNTPASLYKYIQVPYLFSVNSDRHYEDLMEILSGVFENRAVSGYFFAEFNASCPSRFRTPNHPCAAYRISQ